MLPAHAYHTFFVVMGIMAAAYLVRAFFYYIIAYYGHTFGIRVEADIRRDLFRHMQSLGYEFYDHNRTGQLMSRLTTDLFEITELAHHGPEDLMISLLTIVGALAVMFTIEWRLALVVCVILPILLIVVITRRRKMSRVSRILVVADGRICEQGTHEELMCLGGLYATLRSTQDLSSAECPL